MGIFGFFTEIFIDQSSVFHMNLSKSLNLIGCHGGTHHKFIKKFKVILKTHKGDIDLILFIHAYDIATIDCIFLIRSELWLLWQRTFCIDL